MAETELLEAALALPESKKIILVERLLESLTPDDDSVDAKAFAAELQRRSSEIDQGAAQLISWDVLKNESDTYQGE